MSRLSERDMRIGAAIIDAINDDGYVIEPLDEIARNLQPEIVAAAAEVERVLAPRAGDGSGGRRRAFRQ